MFFIFFGTVKKGNIGDFFFWGFFFGVISIFLSYISKSAAVGSIVVYSLATFVLFVEIGFGSAFISFILLVLCGIAAYKSDN